MVSEDKFKLSFFKFVVSLANITAKLGFIKTCIFLNIIPIGFCLKFSLQSGLPKEEEPEMDASIKSVLSKTSMELLNITKNAETLKTTNILEKIQDTFKQIVYDKKEVLKQAIDKFRKILFLRTKLLSGKLKKLSKESHSRSLLDFDIETSKFEANFSIQEDSPTPFISSPTSSPNFPDWFDSFPPLPPPARSRLDWTQNIIVESSPPPRSTPPCSLPSTSSPPISGPLQIAAPVLSRILRPRKSKKPPTNDSVIPPIIESHTPPSQQPTSLPPHL